MAFTETHLGRRSWHARECVEPRSDGWPRKPRSLAAMPPAVDDMPQSPSRLLDDASTEIARVRGMRDAQALFEELYRVARPGAKLFVRVAHGARDDAWQDPAQQRVWTEGSFAHFAQPVHPAGSAYRGDWELESVRLAVVPGGPATAAQILEARNQVDEMTVVLRAVKPARGPRGLHPARPGQPQLSFDPRIDPAFAAA